MPESKFTPAQAEELAAAVASLEDIIASKRATGREKDVADLRRLEQFRIEYQRRQERR